MVSLELTQPWLLLLLLPTVALMVLYYLRSLSDFPRPQRIVSLIARLIVALLLILSVSGLTMLHATREQFVIFVADQSLSIGDEAAREATAFLDAARKNQSHHRTAFLPFAAVAGAVQDEPLRYGADFRNPGLAQHAIPAADGSAGAPSGGADNPVSEPRARAVPADWSGQAGNAALPEAGSRQDGTDIAAAIEAAAGAMPSGYVPHIVVLSDGNETTGDALAAAMRSRVPISVIPLPARAEPEVQVSEVNVPAEVREGEPFLVEVVIHSSHDDEGLVEVYRGDHKVIGETRKLKKGENRLRFQQSVERDRLAAFSARVSGLAHDTLVDNNLDSGLVYTAGKPRILIVDSDPAVIRELAYALEDEGIQADIRPPQGMPESLADLQNYECLILSNVPATALTQRQMEAARTWVQELGGGLMMLGGEQSFGLGGYYRSVIEEILPVRSDFEKEKEKPSLGMVLVIDKSGSMDGEKIDMARSAARSAVELLGPRDQVAVLAFDGDTYVISEMQPASGAARISDEISRIDSGGGTSMYPAMEMSFEMLMATSVKLKHVILLTDGVSSPGDFEGMAQQMASAKITVSTVAVGSDCDAELLEAIARTGRGRSYITDDASQVPQIFARETVTASKSAIDEQPFVPQVVRASHALADLDVESAPFLLGYVMTRPKPTSEVILATEKGDPLLAWWRYGLGMTTAFTSDATSRWAAEWLTWPGYGKFWTQVVRQTMRKSDSRGIQVSAARRGQQTTLTVDAVSDSGRFLNQAAVELTVIDPQLRRSKLVMPPQAPGRYAVDVATPRQGSYHMEIAVSQNGQVVYRQTRGIMVGYSDELRIRPTNTSLLREIATAAGGSYAPTPETLFELPLGQATRPSPLWPWLLAAATLLFTLDVALRRIDFGLHLPGLMQRLHSLRVRFP